MFTFWTPLMRARVTVRNPTARPALDSLRQWYVKMSSHLTLHALNEPAPEFIADFKEFQTAIGTASRDLEQAALAWDGSIRAIKPSKAPAQDS